MYTAIYIQFNFVVIISIIIKKSSEHIVGIEIWINLRNTNNWMLFKPYY